MVEGALKQNQGAVTQEEANKPSFATNDETALQHVLARFQTRRDYKQRYTQRNQLHYEQYRSHAKPRQYPFHSIARSNIFVPYSFATVEQITPRIVRALLGDGYNFFDCYPSEKTDRDNARKHKKVLQWQIEMMNFYIEFAMLVKTAVMFGYCAGKLSWCFKVGEKRKLQKKESYKNRVIEEEVVKKWGHAMYEEVVEKNEILFDSNLFQCLAWDDAYPDERCRYTLHTGRDFIHQGKMSLRELLQQRRPDGRPLYKNLDKITISRSMGAKGPYSQADSDKDRRLGTIGAAKETWRSGANLQYDRAGQEVELLEYWSRDWVITVANRQVVIRREPNFYWHKQLPFVDFNYTYVPNELFGIGAIESFRDLQRALNVITNMDLDNWSQMVNQMFIVHRQADIPQEQLVSRPWGVVYSSLAPKDAVFPIQKQSVAGETTMKQQEMRANIQLASGLTDMHYLGTSSGSRLGRTATGVVQAMEETNTRFQLAVNLAEFMTLNPLLRMMASNNQQFMRTPKWIRVTGETEPELVYPEHIWGEIDIRFRGAQRLSKIQMDQHNLTNFLRAIGNNPYLMNSVKVRELMKRALPLFFDTDADELLVDLPHEVRSPEEEHELMMWGQPVEPNPDEDVEMHLQKHLMMQKHPIYGQWDPTSRALMEQHVQLTLRLWEMIQQANVGAELAAAAEEAGQMGSQGALTREASGVGNNPVGGTSNEEKGYV